MELLVKPEILTSYISKLTCGTVVCKHFAGYQGYPNFGTLRVKERRGFSHLKRKL
jgi:hypothetical protein